MDIRKVKNIADLINYFSQNLNWDIDMEDFDDIEDVTYDFSASDIGLKDESFAKISALRQLQPLVDGQKWGIFCVEFDSNRFEPSALKKILSGLIPRKRNSADHAVWEQQDLLFICNWGNDNNSTIGLAHFEDREGGLPQIKMFSCAPALEDFTQINHFEQRLSLLAWPKDTSNIAKWRETWSSAFTMAYHQTIQDSSTLTIQLAAEAQNIQQRIIEVMSVETENGYVHKLYKKFKDTLINDMTEKQFADMYAQTVVYGLFSARCMDTSQNDFSAEEAVDCIPNTNPFLKSLMKECFGVENTSALSFDELEIGNVVDLLTHTKTDEIIKDFNRQTGGGKEDPVIHFYEEFLTAYDKAQKVQRGVYYTPQPVVNFMVRAVDDIIKSEFGYEDGLATTATKKIRVKSLSSKKINGFYREVERFEEVPAIQVLDPATGTGTFVRQIILQIYENFCEKRKSIRKELLKQEWCRYVDEHLLPRINAFELMMAPYSVAHMKLAMTLKDTGYDFSGRNRLNVFLCNTLERPGNSDMAISLFDDDPLALESIEANSAKKNKGINIVIGNPPYSGESANKGDFIMHLMEDYKLEPGTSSKLEEANSKFINDDYVKFIRYAETFFETDGQGILCYINPHGYIDSPTFRGVRYKLLSRFDKLYVINLHGNSKKKERCPDGSKDENVFDIQQGVSINLFVKSNDKKSEFTVLYYDLYGQRDTKYSFLADKRLTDINWEVYHPFSPNYELNHKQNTLEAEYNLGFSVRELYNLGTLGVLSKRDSLVVGFTEKEVIEKLELFRNKSIDIEEVCSKFGIPVKDNDKWDAMAARLLLNKIDNLCQYIRTIHYRPFDIRYIFYEPTLIARPNTKVLQHLLGGNNLALVICRQGNASNLDEWDSAIVVNSICDQNIYRRGGGTVLPLYLYNYGLMGVEKEPNFSKNIINDIETRLGCKLSVDKSNDVFTPEQLLGYVYFYLNSKKYKTKYKEFIGKDFPKIPYPEDYASFLAKASLGTQLINIQTNYMNNDVSTIEMYGLGDCQIDKIAFKEEKLYINKIQYIYPVSEKAFFYTIGGNSPIQKWLKDRKGMAPNHDEITHLKKIISTVTMTVHKCEEIDSLVE